MKEEKINQFNKLLEADIIYKRVLRLSESYFNNDSVGGDLKNFIKEAEFMFQGFKSNDVIVSIFNHNTYSSVSEIGAKSFWGDLPKAPKTERISQILSLLDKNYISFPNDSVSWLTDTLQSIPVNQRVNFKFFHCGICYRRLDNKVIRLFSKGLPFHYNTDGQFTFTFNYVENIAYLIKKDFEFYWIRFSYGANNEFVHSFHSDGKESSKKDLLTKKQKEILKLISEDYDTKEISEKLFISQKTVGNHRSNMINKLGVRDSTALLQIAKMAEII
ncbi:MAG: LuxR C-terminal-related transcriptional regulator [Flavobacterium sp.]